VRSIFRSMLNYPFQLIRRLLNPPHSPYTPLFRSAVTAAAGMDILCHALESYTATPYDAGPRKQPHERVPYCGANPIADMWAERSLSLLARAFRTAVRDGADEAAREQMALAATFAGLGFGNAGVHIPHACAYPIAGRVRSYRPEGYPDPAGTRERSE